MYFIPTLSSKGMAEHGRGTQGWPLVSDMSVQGARCIGLFSLGASLLHAAITPWLTHSQHMSRVHSVIHNAGDEKKTVMAELERVGIAPGKRNWQV